MKRFISFILLILLCFIFLGFGVSFAATESGIGQQIEQAAASPSLTDNNTMEYSTSAFDSIFAEYNCLVLSQNFTMFDRQNIINTIKAKHTAIKADGTIAPEIGSVLKCPIRDKPVV